MRHVKSPTVVTQVDTLQREKLATSAYEPQLGADTKGEPVRAVTMTGVSVAVTAGSRA